MVCFTGFVGCMRKEVCIQNIAQNVEWAGQGPEENYDEIALAVIKIFERWQLCRGFTVDISFGMGNETVIRRYGQCQSEAGSLRV